VRCVARSIEVLEDSHTVVLPDETVETWVRDHGVGHVTKVHKGMVMPMNLQDDPTETAYSRSTACSRSC
jgi:hypothetical protein